VNKPTDTQIDGKTGRERRRKYARNAVRAAMLVAAALLLSASGEWRLAVIVPAASPLTTVTSLLATRMFQLASLVGLSVAAITLIRHRLFCRWACPTGTCAECCSMLNRRRLWRPKLPRVGQWVALLTLGGAAIGYPVVAWLDPLAIFSGSFGVLHSATSPRAAWYALGLATVLVLSVVWPGLWCSSLCPLGAFQDLLFRLNLAIRRVMFGKRKRSKKRATVGLSRRVVLASLAGVALAAMARGVRSAAGRVLRPPGAVDEERFTGLCTRCGNCLRACPANIIRPATAEHGISGLLTPELDFTDDYCREDCVRCSQVCPSGAIETISREEKATVSIGLPQVDMDLCLLGDDRDCFLCRSMCPYEAITLEFCEEEYTLTPRIDAAKCPGCGACQTACPTAPKKAIVIVPTVAARE